VDDGYAGPALLVAGEDRIEVTVALGGHFEPLDGRYHWGGRVAPGGGVAELVRAGTRDAYLVIDGRERALRMIDVDPWGGVTVRATGPAPW
jgi:hypothetical protein